MVTRYSLFNTQDRGSVHLKHASKGKDKATADAHEEDGGHVKEERHGCVGNEDEGSHDGNFPEGLHAFREGNEEHVDRSTNLTDRVRASQSYT